MAVLLPAYPVLQEVDANMAEAASRASCKASFNSFRQAVATRQVQLRRVLPTLTQRWQPCSKAFRIW
jgi:hypothetical protein